MSENYSKWNVFSEGAYDFSNDCFLHLLLRADAGKMWFKFGLRAELQDTPWELLGKMLPYGEVFFLRLKEILTKRAPADVVDELIPSSMEGIRTWMLRLLHPTTKQLLIAGVVGRALKVWQIPKLETVFRAVFWGPTEREQLCHALSVSETEFDGAHKAACVVLDTLYGVFSNHVGDASDEAQIAWIKKWGGLA